MTMLHQGRFVGSSKTLPSLSSHAYTAASDSQSVSLGLANQRLTASTVQILGVVMDSSHETQEVHPIRLTSFLLDRHHYEDQASS
jgi:hypothetical protein